MPVFSSDPTVVQNLIAAGQQPFYCFGGLITNTEPTKGHVTNLVGTGSVATASLTLTNGRIPVVGQLITIKGTVSSSGAFNVTNAKITGVGGFNTGDNSTGTVTFASATTLATTADTGDFLAPQAETSEAIVNNSSSIAVMVQQNGSTLQQGRSIMAEVIFPTLPTAVTVKLSDAMAITDPVWNSLGTVASVTASAQTGSVLEIEFTPGRFFRFDVTGLTGSGLIIAKIYA